MLTDRIPFGYRASFVSSFTRGSSPGLLSHDKPPVLLICSCYLVLHGPGPFCLLLPVSRAPVSCPFHVLSLAKSLPMPVPQSCLTRAPGLGAVTLSALCLQGEGSEDLPFPTRGGFSFPWIRLLASSFSGVVSKWSLQGEASQCGVPCTSQAPLWRRPVGVLRWHFTDLILTTAVRVHLHDDRTGPGPTASSSCPFLSQPAVVCVPCAS